SEKLDERVGELAAIVNVGRLLSGSLERRTLITNIASETVRLVGSASRFVIGSFDARHENIVVDAVLRGDTRGVERRTTRAARSIEPVHRSLVPRGFGLPGWVMQNRRPLLLTDVQTECHAYVTSPKEIPKCVSWLGVPLTIYDEVFGVMAVESDSPLAYNADHLRVLTIIADHAAVALENARLYELATVDGLTGLFVRRYFDQRLNEEWRRGARYGQEFALGILDLDNFKRLNDTYGHQIGDQVLRGAATVLRDNMRGADLAGRYGGEEFAFILPRTTVNEAHVMAERIRKDIEMLNLELNGQQITVTCSIGIAGYPECNASDASTLLAFADQALYDAKAQGRNRVVAAAHTEMVPKSARDGTDGRKDGSEAITLEMVKPNIRA
ncbi:MAG: GGDEF domain-containing protein, partial [Clostridia bacterium]|nr:GGDEF domain-containing protein [Deltaproteobacteria bacterium]